MTFLRKFTKLMKSEPLNDKKRSFAWTIDESKCLSIDEVKRLRITCENQRQFGIKDMKYSRVRNWFVIELGLNTGLRVAEMASLKHSNLLIEGSRSSIVVIGKGNKKRAIWINSEFKKTCERFINYKKQFNYSIDDESPLLNNLKGGKISKRALQKSFKDIIKKAGLSLYYYIHCLRHTYTTFLLKASNYNYRFVQQQLGHSSIKTTQVYAGIVDSEGRKAVENLYM
jgi:site-specific recombinase XerD